ncbi:MAG: hypothetical protein ACRDWT_12975 [Jatrophihabitantaceae bacterium]
MIVRRRTRAAAAVAALGLLTACSTAPPAPIPSPPTTAGTGASIASTSSEHSSAGPRRDATTTAAPGNPTPPARRVTTLPDRKARAELAVPGVPEPKIQLPRGGRTILGSYRLVAYYGGPDGRALGALGGASPERMAQVISKRAAQYAAYGRTVQPAMELIASVAQGSPGADQLYSRTISPAAVQRYLSVAHRHRMLLILDFQPGRGDFLPQVRRFARFLADPSVSVALDPEWMMHGRQVPGQVIGWSSAASINRVQDYLSRLVRSHALPDKLLMVHQFTVGMLPDRNRIGRYPGLELTFHADGFGTRAQKLATYRRLSLPGRPDGAGFKLFLTQDSGLMTSAQVMALSPRPDVITYQ